MGVNSGGNIGFYTRATARLSIDGGTGNITIPNNVGIRMTSSNCRLYINTNAGNGVNSIGLRIASGGGTDGANFFCGIGLAHEANGWSKSAIGHVRTGPYDKGDLVFLKNNFVDNSDCNMSHERMRITNAGNVACTGSISCVGVSTSGGCVLVLM